MVQKIKVQKYIIETLGVDRARKEVQFITAELRAAGLPVTNKSITQWLADVADAELQ